ncbi:MBL fold metallo-hydrolase [Oscillatoria sp. FACHB-1407]|uniref:MBL fold metallo-hydrolase n=1 Tax=Oscillatoria sp. FACHB-1407 TaxID=2692847 RepID=UPI0016833FE6|nr:MBL fold metallo-hydrolase [Oscillatoria sp. FACHB-1407]MBD2462011.1 MBL fold metallo-hydrolase [Oscillatoria sp. FACHB-1407]
MPSLNPTGTSNLSVDPNIQTEADVSQFVVEFWGVRGSIPTPGKETVRYGGNTACVEIKVGGKRLIFDGGTGLRALGKHLLSQMPVEAHLFFTHTHWDRIQGFPFFIPAFVPDNHFHIYGATGLNGASIKQRLTDQMLRPHFPVPLQMMQSNLTFHNIAPGEVITLDDVVIETISLNRPNSALGYRVTWNGHSVVYATDTEHSPERIEQSLRYLAYQADVLIFDAVYADHTYFAPEAANGVWQPEAWLASIEVAIAASVKQIIIFHHDPAHEDDLLDKVEAEVQSRFSNVKLAREGMVLQVYKESN